MMPPVTNTEAANQETKLSSRVSLVRCLTGLLRGGRQQGLLINALWSHRFQARELASTLDERGWSSSGPTEVWLHGHDLGGKAREINPYYSSYYSDPCVEWDGYTWVNICY